MTWACTETSSADTGSSAIDQLRLERQRPRDADPLALAAGELVRVAVGVLGLQADVLEQLAHARAGSPARRDAVDRAAARRGSARPPARVERRVGVLEDHLHLAPHRAQRRAAQRRDVAPVELDRARGGLGAAAAARARAWTCRSPTRRPARASRPRAPPARRRRRRARSPTSRWTTPVPRTPKCRCTSVARRSGAAHAAPRSRSDGRAPRAAGGRRRGARGRAWPRAAAAPSSARRRYGQRRRTGSRSASASAAAACPRSRSAAAGAAGRGAGSSRAAPTCRGAAGRGRSRASGPARRRGPPYITSTRSASSATTPRSWVMRMTDAPVSRRSVRIRSRIWAWIVTSSAVVGSSAISTRGWHDERHRDHHPLAHAARELVRVVVDALRGVRDPDRAQQLDRARRAPRPPTRRSCCADRLGDLPADRVDRVQRRHRVLEDHRDLLAAHAAHLALRQRHQVAAAVVDRALEERVALRHQPHHAHHRDALARAGLADDPEHLVGPERERDAVDGGDVAAVGAEGHAQVADVEQRLVAHAVTASRVRGSRRA